jgi:stage V sporulation protein AD
MENKRIGKSTVEFKTRPVIAASSSIVGPLEGQGPLGNTFDIVLDDNLFGEKSWEKAERKMLLESVKLVISKVGLMEKDIDYHLAGDLLNQTISANFAARDLQIPFLGLYGACSTMAESMILGGMLVDGGYARRVVASVSSHYDTAERQYRFPTPFGTQRRMTAQRTVTGAGAVMLCNAGEGPVITHATVGKVVDLGIKDPNNMGAAMAPAAADTIVAHFKDTGRTQNDYDLIISGDLAQVGKNLTQELVAKEGYDISQKYDDCGMLIYYEHQDAHAGGSGCACSAVVFCGHLIEEIKKGNLQRILFIGTGALLSPTSSLQGDSIPGIAHAVAIEDAKGVRKEWHI